MTSIPLDPWGLLNLGKFFQLVFALLLIQSLGVLLVRWLGRRHGLFLTGFLAGLISSTALTLALAKQSNHPKRKRPAELLPFMAAIFAMLLEALFFSFFGISVFHWQILIIFSGPLIATVITLAIVWRSDLEYTFTLDKEKKIDLWGTIKLVALLMLILAASNGVQRIAGTEGLMVLTYLVSLFEIHGSVISTTQLYEAQSIDLKNLGTLLSLSLLASYSSKVALVMFIGSGPFKRYVVASVAGAVLMLGMGLVVFRMAV